VEHVSVFRYVIVHDRPASERSYSPFQLFSREWVRLYSVLVSVLQAPACFPDLVNGIQGRINLRATSRSRISIIVIGVEDLPRLTMPMTVLVTTPQTDEAGRTFCRSSTQPILHLPSVPIQGETGLDDWTFDTFRTWMRRVVQDLEATDPETAEYIRTFPPEPENVSLGEAATISTQPLTLSNDLAVASIDYPRAVRPTTDSADDDGASLIEFSYRQIRELRDRYLEREQYPAGLTELLVVCPSSARDLPGVLPKEHRHDAAARRAYGLITRKNTLLLSDDLKTLKQASPIAKDMISSREGEFDALMISAAVEACSQFIPTVPLLSAPAGSSGFVRELNEVLRGRYRDWRQRASRLARQAGEQMSRVFPAFALKDLERDYGTVKFLADDPLELLPSKGRPLCLVRPCVRLPVTPGFVLESQLRMADPVILHPADFAKVLILRGTSPRERIFPLLESFSRLMLKSSGVDVSIVDVTSVTELRNALETFDGAMAVVDAHGIHTERSSGRIKLGETHVDAATLSRDLKVPPIVFLAACETHAVQGRQDTVATALLSAGARTVIGTLGAVGGPESAALCANVLFLISTFMPKAPGPMRWSELFWMAAAQAHAAEGAMALRGTGLSKIKPQDVQDVSIAALEELVLFKKEWFERVLREVASIASLSVDEVRRLWTEHAYITDSALHVQLGQADTLFVAHTDTWGL
jgi:hypothetical protein